MMNISTGGPHILLFERDQQLVALLTSELQLAGYESHAARTAVEVFDAIARYPVRLVLVNLAQAAAARREFWVALDTQRRGRGVQVLTFHCTNLAGYGPPNDDVEERSQTMLADMEVDGMLGIMNMVNAIRSRIAISNTGAISRLAANVNSTPAFGIQATAPLPTVSPDNSGLTSVGIGLAGSPTEEHAPLPTAPLQSSVPFTTTPAPPSTSPEVSRTATPNPADKIRAVIYPNQRSWSASTSYDNYVAGSQYSPPGEQPVQDTNWTQSPQIQQPSMTSTSASTPSPQANDSFANGPGKQSNGEATLPRESGLAQLSRMLEEQRSPMEEELVQRSDTAQKNQLQDEATLNLRARPEEVTPISAMPLRASPIQDMPINRGGQGDSSPHANPKRSDEATQSRYPYSQSSPQLMSIAATPPSPTPVQALSPSPPQSPQKEETQRQNAARISYNAQPGDSSPRESFAGASKEEHDNTDQERVLVERTANTNQEGQTEKAPDNPVLLDIVQSLPPMPSPPPQPKVHNGRATLSLGRVLLEGHLVPQNRLEVAQGIQRMLRGVDMNYQLGEILLMFKLLTPDQLLAASLVSYGLITTAQISALGRIRQELHSIGLEYDLENLLILFRILTSEQLREVRESWSS